MNASVPIMRSVRDLELDGKRVFVRVDFNVPLEGGRVADDTRIRASIPTIRLVLEKGGLPVLASHLGRPKGKPNPEFSLSPAASVLASHLGIRVGFAQDCVGEAAGKAAAGLKQGEALLLENLRFHPGEEKNEPEFARQLASLAGAYVNDAFGSAHRAHASVEAICPLLPSAAGLLMEKELDFLGRLLAAPQRPYIVVLGGAKVSDKVALVRNLLPRADAFLIGGAMAYTFLAARGVQVGSSRVEKGESLDLAGGILSEAERRGVRIELPVDHRVAGSLNAPGPGETTPGEAIPAGRIGMDIGPRTMERFAAALGPAATVLWNGPVGLFEQPPFDEGSRRVAEAIASSKALSVAGGGDTAAALARFHLEGRFSHVSTGGGASLEFLSGMELPGVRALALRS
jgi:phosphoglycerate kinase